MRPVLLDTNSYTAFKSSDEGVTEVLQLAEKIFLSPIVIGELLAGFDGGKRAERNKMEFQKFMESPRVFIPPIAADTATFFSQIYDSLKRKGRPIPTNDMWIAAQALEHGSVVCTFDRHFSFIEGLISGTSANQLFIF
jgi:tRNA(fMet)-specific endonuclease VapC